MSFVNSVADGTRKAKRTNEKERKHTLLYLTRTKLIFLMVLPPEMPLSSPPREEVQQIPVDRINDGKMCQPSVFRKH